MAKRNSSEMQTGNAEGQVRRPKKGASFVGGARPSGLWAVPAAVFFFIFGILPLFIVWGCHSSNGMAWARPSSLEGSTGPSSFMIPKS